MVEKTDAHVGLSPIDPMAQTLGAGGTPAAGGDLLGDAQGDPNQLCSPP